MIGWILDHDEITAQLGKGGMGEVYRAIDTKLGRNVALNVLPPAFADGSEFILKRYPDGLRMINMFTVVENWFEEFRED